MNKIMYYVLSPFIIWLPFDHVQDMHISSSFTHKCINFVYQAIANRHT